VVAACPLFKIEEIAKELEGFCLTQCQSPVEVDAFLIVTHAPIFRSGLLNKA
jgi:hypothetical protein